MTEQKVKCPKCGQPARKHSLFKPKTGKPWRMYIHAEHVVGGMFSAITKSCYVEEAVS